MLKLTRAESRELSFSVFDKCLETWIFKFRFRALKCLTFYSVLCFTMLIFADYVAFSVLLATLKGENWIDSYWTLWYTYILLTCLNLQELHTELLCKNTLSAALATPILMGVAWGSKLTVWQMTVSLKCKVYLCFNNDGNI